MKTSLVILAVLCMLFLTVRRAERKAMYSSKAHLHVPVLMISKGQELDTSFKDVTRIWSSYMVAKQAAEMFKQLPHPTQLDEQN